MTRLSLAFVVILSALASLGCGNAATAGSMHSAGKPAAVGSSNGGSSDSSGGAAIVSGGTESEQALVTSTLTTIDATDIKAVTIAEPSGPLGGLDGQEVSVDLGPVDGSAMIQAQWEAFLVVGQLRDQSATASSNAQQIVGFSLSNGIIENLEGVDHPPIQPMPIAVDDIKTAVNGLGLTPTAVNVYDLGSGEVVKIDATSSDYNSFVTKYGGQALSLIFGDLNRYEGVDLEVDDPSGTPVYVAASASRVARGSEWISNQVQGLPTS